tara:strand:+ start:144 stop:344 length:201 start_codon:yes stop_codon:yes gene_type:complete
MFTDKTQMLIILILAAAHVLVSGLMVFACYTSKDKNLKKCGGLWILSLVVCAIILTFAIMQYQVVN